MELRGMSPVLGSERRENAWRRVGRAPVDAAKVSASLSAGDLWSVEDDCPIFPLPLFLFPLLSSAFQMHIDQSINIILLYSNQLFTRERENCLDMVVLTGLCGWIWNSFTTPILMDVLRWAASLDLVQSYLWYSPWHHFHFFGPGL